MARFRRIARRITSVICITAIVLLMVLWLGSMYRINVVDISVSRVSANSTSIRGILGVSIGLYPSFRSFVSQDANSFVDLGGDWGWVTVLSYPMPSAHTYAQFYFNLDTDFRTIEIHFPLWLAILLLSIFRLWHLSSYIRRRRSILARHILCSNCGYDLIGLMGETCPECGSPIPASHNPAMNLAGGISGSSPLSESG